MNQYEKLSRAMNSMMESIEQTSRLMSAPHFSEIVMSNLHEWRHRLGLAESVIEQAAMNMERISKALPVDRFYERHISSIDAMVNRLCISDLIEKQDRMLQSIGNALTIYGSMADKCAQIADTYSGIVAALDGFQSRMPQIEEMGLNYFRIASALGQALQKTAEESDFEVDDISIIAAKCYEAETDEEQKVLQDIINPTQDEAVKSKKAKFSAIVKKFLFFLLTSFIASLIDVGVEMVLINNPPEINQYYIQNITNNLIIEGYEVNELNEWGYRIVNREIILRAKPGKSSYVTGHLQIGKVVRIIRKYKKWVEVTWTNENGESCIGWIQNYTLSALSY